MALYKDASELIKSDDSRFDATHKPGSTVPYSGIYMCTSCRDEIASNKGDPFPPQNHRQHRDTSKPILWKLLVQTQNGPPS
jgi:hypothetical protein